jgi:acyl carrier protein
VVLNIGAEVKDILVFHLGSDAAKVTDSAKLTGDLGADSLDVVELVMSCEEKFDIRIPNHVATKFVTVGDVIAFIEAAMAERPKPARRPSRRRFSAYRVVGAR